jgi:L-lactate permease
MSARNLFIVRIMLMVGVAGFTAGVLVARSRSPDGFAGVLPLVPLRYALWALAVAAAGAALFIKSRMESADPDKRPLMTLIGWSFGEGVACFGIVLFFAGADVSTLALGLLTFAFTLIVLPGPRVSD